ncbi:hypothetical protein N7532_004026 [Penicillium argentinense]|uniref:Histone transcription regulator 3 homolog n=1 Tax=Penicillium argentinense TaxID=1131581 RepID=A0A9W9FNK8_9EURO|nr:uncharacterized protein N7532_004026 [Penicillium argentinense]KAJ5103497.1 hypothetical protein N7532_004026 [Penicillium argentinense]
MASWVALNVEPDDAVEEEVDDTKELQIEEALKLYHNALKLHSQGPDFYTQAAEAYDALLNSEIFKYPESISDFKRATLPDAQSTEPVDESPTDAIVEYNVSDSTSSLFQTLYLSRKNYGKYLLDVLHETLREPPKDDDAARKISKKSFEATKKALTSFAEALERDDTDLNLWRQSARLGSALQSYRLNRFCLESVLADDDNRLEVRPEQLGLEEIFSEERLRSALKSLFDGLSASQIPVKKPKKALVKYLKKHEDLYEYLPNLPDDLQLLDPSKGPLSLSTSRLEITPSDATWESVGQSILEALDDEDDDSEDDEDESITASPNRAIQIVLPARDSTPQEDEEMAEPDNAPENDDAQVRPEIAFADMPQVGEQSAETEAEQPQPEPGPGPSEPGEEHSSIDQSAEKQLMESLEGESAQIPERQGSAGDETNAEEADPKSPSETRKRSSASAANDDFQEGGRMKSRRTRARESNADALVQPEEIAFDQEKYYEDRLEVFVNADEWMFNTINSLFSKFDMQALGSIESLKATVAAVSDSSDVPEEPEARLFQDFRGIIKNWNDEKSRLMQQKDDLSSLKDIRGSSKSGLSVFLEHSRKATRKPLVQEISAGEKVYAFCERVNRDWFHQHACLYEWLKCLLMPNFGEDTSDWSVQNSTYISSQWPEELKETVVELLVREDEFLYTRMQESVASLERRILDLNTEMPFEYQTSDLANLEMIQSIYELHLEIYSSVDAMDTKDSQEEKSAQKERLGRWGTLSRFCLEVFIENCPSEEPRQNLCLRHLWTSVFHLNLAGEAQREHVLLCLQDLKFILQSIGDPSIHLVNNSVIPELSNEAIDQEMLKLKCMDFFAKVFNPGDEDPVSLIEAIEPILEPSSIEYPEGNSDTNDLNEPPSHFSEMASFLDRGDATLRLFLWRRLQETYQSIDYPPKVVSCYLRSIETVMKELEHSKHTEETSSHRQVALLGWLKSLDGILAKAIPLILQDPRKAYECVDMDHLHASMSAVARLARLLQSFILYEDSVRVGQISGRDLRGSLAKSLENFKERMRELYVRCWILQYTMFLEAISQNQGLFDDPLEDRIRFLRSVHNSLGVRSMCRYSQKRFLKLIKSELLNLETKGDYEFDIYQVLYDLHGIKFSPTDGTADHGCSTEKLDRPTAIMMIDFVMKQAKKMNMKDLSKSELKTTVEKMQAAIGPVKPSSQSPQMNFNRRTITTYFKNPINPSNLLRAVQGVTELPLLPVPGENATIAAKGWYFLLGHVSLTKFRSQKRLGPGSVSELDDAVNFFRQDLEYGTGRWETWYRLAQAYDTQLEEDITWAADKMNNNRSDLATTQRYAIHCYAMAASTAIGTAEPTTETRDLLSDLYTDFGIRMYSSSREPLSMGAFGVADFSRHFSNAESQQMYKAQPFKEMSLYSVWNFASNILRRAVNAKPGRWLAQYFLGKCLWKMFSCDDSMRTTSRKVEMHDVIDALLDSIAALPQRKDSRADPIFEPHFKLLSVVHKLVTRGAMTVTEASKTLSVSPWARKVDTPENMEGWKPYILEVIKRFKSADKSNWHHRMSAKAAHIIYDDQQNAAAAAAAKHEMSQIFTKTLTIQVWRPEFERPGRHFVYTTRYVYFFISLLDQLDDRASLDQLLRRVRKKQGDFINHSKLWEDACSTYAKMIRRAAGINEKHEESVFKPIGWEEFSTKSARLERLKKLSDDSMPLLELVRDSLDLKKLNNTLLKVTMFEDLVADLYSRVYELNLPQLVEQANEENKEKMKVNHLLMSGDVTADVSAPTTPVPASDTPAPRGRTKGISRRDIQKRSDTLVNLKLGPRTAASKFTTATETEQTASTPREPNTTSLTELKSTPQDSGKLMSTAGDNANAQNVGLDGVNESGDDSDATETDATRTNNRSKKQGALIDSKKETGEVETENDDAGSGNEGADEGEGEDEDGGDDDGEGDAGTTEAETGGEEPQEGDDAGDEMQDGDGEDQTAAESKAADGENDESAKATGDEGAESTTTVKNEDTENPEPMDTSSA